MDVTAMLNTSTEAGGQSKLEDSMDNPFRGRTPWDAGGYSLPIHTHHLGSFTDDPFPNDSLVDNHIDQRRHKLSDSHSSLSSSASSNSISHSRFSSMSTVGSLHLPSQTISEAIFTDSEISSHSSKTATGSSSPVSPRTGRSASQSSSSPALYGSGLVLIAERHFYGSPRKESVDQIFTVTEAAKVRSADFVDGNREGRLASTSQRPASPSDAILIKRTTPPIIPHFTGQPITEDIEYSHPYLDAPTQENMLTVRDPHPGQLSIPARSHKRAISAPDFAGNMAEHLQSGCRDSTSSDPISDLTPLCSPPKALLHAETALCPAPDIPPAAIKTPQDRRPCCMYIANCDTGSQLRKAVSHIFGRNKMCTRRIPPDVWVWYCRKHYQRARYRNAKEWARTLQYDLVSQQIKRLQEWSEENLRTGERGRVEDYRLAIRKREQRRLDARKPKGEGECSDSEVDEANEFQGEASSSTAVPDWLLSLSGKSHNASQIMEIIDGIQADLTENNLSAWPDIEILPNIILDRDESEITKGYTKRGALSGAHSRSQSLGSAARLDEDATGAWESHGKLSPSDAQSQPGGNPQKRKRTDDREEENDAQSTPQSQRIRVSERQLAAIRQGPHTTQRPVFRNLSENQDAEENFGNIGVPGQYHRVASSSHALPPVAPRPQRYTSLPTAAYIDPSVPSTEGSSSVTRRGLHKRSHSDIGGLHSYQTTFRITNRYQHQNAAPVHYDRPVPRRLFSPPGLHASFSHAEGLVLHQRAHIRHQSTPIVPLSIRCPVASPSGYRTLPRISSPSLASSRDMVDSIRALDLHSGRRR